MCINRYRKIPNDVCRGGFSPDGKKIDLGVTCGTQTSGDISVEEVVQQTETKVMSDTGNYHDYLYKLRKQFLCNSLEQREQPCI